MKLKYLTALYSSLDQEYNQAMSGPYEDLSYHGDDCKVIAGLKDGRISGCWRPVVALGDDKGLKLHIERLFNICSNIYYLDFLINGQLSVISQFLLRHGHTARPYYTQIIDLTKSEKELHAGLRKSYKSLCNQGFGGIDTALGPLRKLHLDVREQKRGFDTWQIQAKMIDMQQAFVSIQDEEKAACLIYHNRHTSYYACGASEKDVNSHSCVWMAVLQAKALGCNAFEMGEQVFDVGAPMMERGKLSMKKDVDISLFKRGFGGRTQMRLILEK